jgi:hypothetical protein
VGFLELPKSSLKRFATPGAPIIRDGEIVDRLRTLLRLRDRESPELYEVEYSFECLAVLIGAAGVEFHVLIVIDV